MQEKILAICEELCCKKVTIDEQLIISGLLDSFKIMELICSLEDEFQISFSPEEIQDLDHFSCVDHMMELIHKKLAEK